MKILTAWLRAYLPSIPVTDRELADDLTLRGIAVEGVHPLGLGSGSLFEMDITTNRVDAMNHYGIAREAATIYNLPLPSLSEQPALVSLLDVVRGKGQLEPPPGPHPPPSAIPLFEVRVDAPELCGRFTARILRDVTIAPSIGQVKTFFDLLGQKQISNAVDASNYTLLGMGHPTHAFDLDKIEGGTVIVRLAHPGEKLRLLDGTERTLDPDDLVIADKRKAISLAGVMGGFDTMITPETRNILVESAGFDPATIRRSSRRHNLHTDASHRFERGADFNAAPLANQLVSTLILEHGGHADGILFDLIDPATERRTSARPPISLSVQEVQRHLGVTLDDTPDKTPGDVPSRSALTGNLVHRYLTALGCTLSSSPGSSDSTATPAPPPQTIFEVTLPSWRLDLEREIDLIEEIARVHGYNRFANTLPAPRPVLAHPTDAPEHAVRTRLLALGFSETISSTFSSTPDNNLFAPSSTSAEQGSAASPRHPVPLENPLSEAATTLRPSLLPGMLAMLSNNLNRDVTTARLFEQGHVFEQGHGVSQGHGISAEPQSRVPHLRDGPIVAKVGEAPRETPSSPQTVEDLLSPIDHVSETASLALGLTTAAPHPTSLYPAADAPIFQLKGVIESIASLFSLPGGASALTFTTDHPPTWLHPGRSATALLGKQSLAFFGELSPAEALGRKLRQPVFLAAIDLAQLYALPLRKVTAHELSRFQAVERDFSFLFPDSTHWHLIASAIHALSLLDRLAPIEIFRDPRGNTVPAGYHSLLLRTVFQSTSRTLTDDELTASSNRIIEALTQLGGTHRA